MKTYWWTIVALLGFQANAQEIDLQKLVQETQVMRQEAGSLNLVWWIPTVYWQESLRKSDLPSNQQQDMLKTIDEYILVAVLEGKVGTLGVLASTAKEELEKKSWLFVGADNLRPIPESELSPGARNFVQVMKPVVANMMGSMGQGLHFLAFSAKDTKGKKRIDPKLPGKVMVKVGDKEYSFRLPLGSLLPPKIDSDSGEHFPGNYEFNPYTGRKLSNAK